MRAMSTSSASIKPMPVVASSTVASVNVWARITPARSTLRWSFFQPRWPRPPCFAAAHSPSPTIERPVLSTMRWIGPVAGTRCSSTSRCRLRARKRGVVGRCETDVHQEEDRLQEVLRLAQRQPEDEPECQRRRDREIREPLLPIGLTGWRRSPRVPRVGRESQRHVASLYERSLIRPPIPDAIFRLALRMHSRLHGEIVRRGPSTRPADRRSPTGARLRSRAPTRVPGKPGQGGQDAVM